MKDKNPDILNFILQPFILDILEMLRIGPKRFGEFKNKITNERTLSLKLTKLQDYEFIVVNHKKTKNGYFNFYTLTTKGRRVVKAVDKLRGVSE